jgi:hypothetical protein
LDKVITTALLIIAGVVVAVMLYNVVYPAVIQSGEALTRRQRRIDEHFSRISYGDWTYAIENDTEWKPAATLGITITGDLLVADTTYFVKVGLPNGVSDDYYFSPSE